MLRPLAGQAETALLGQRFLADILGVFQPLGLHADILEESVVRAVFFAEKPLHAAHALAGDGSEAATAGHPVQQLQGRLPVAEGELQPAGDAAVDDAPLVALHGKGHDRAGGNGVQSIGVAVKIGFDDIVGVKDAAVGPQAGGILVLGPVHRYTFSLERARFQDKAVHRLAAGHGAAEPAGVGHVLGEAVAEDFGGDLLALGMGAVLEIVHRQKVIVIHRRKEAGGAHLAHAVLGVVQFADLPADSSASINELAEIGGTVLLPRHPRVAHHQGQQFFVPEHGAGTAPAGLLHPHRLPPGIVEGKIEDAHTGIGSAAARGHHGDILLILFREGVDFGEPFADQVGGAAIQIKLLYGHPAGLAVDKDDHIALRLALELQGVPARELQVGPEIAAHIAVHDGAGQGRQGHHQRFARSGILGNAPHRPRRDDDLILGIVPFCLGRHRLPQVPQAEALASRKELFHLFRHGFLIYCTRG